jgi:hypothetical protein
MKRTLTGRAGDWLARNGWPHLTMIVSFAVAGWAAYECSTLLMNWAGLALRFSVNFLAGYATFLFCLSVWLATKPTLDRSELLDGAPQDIETKDPWDDEAIERRGQMAEHVGRSVNDAPQGNAAQALVGLALLAMIIGALIVASHMIWYARWHLGRMLVAGGKVSHRTLGAAPAVAWLVTPFRQTVWAAVILLVHYALLGLILQLAFPQAQTVVEIMRKVRN